MTKISLPLYGSSILSLHLPTPPTWSGSGHGCATQVMAIHYSGSRMNSTRGNTCGRSRSPTTTSNTIGFGTVCAALSTRRVFRKPETRERNGQGIDCLGRPGAGYGIHPLLADQRRESLFRCPSFHRQNRPQTIVFIECEEAQQK